MRRTICYLIGLLCFVVTTNAQKDSLNVDKGYWEDQLYFSINYNLLNDQPKETESSDFSYGFTLGYIKDIPFNKRGNWSSGIGLGYSFDSFSHSLEVTETRTIGIESPINKFKVHNIECPIQFRWRTSDISTYSFWRVYVGLRLSYNIKNVFENTREDNSIAKTVNLDDYNTFQKGLELSAGYGAFNIFAYYGLSSIYKNRSVNTTELNSKIVKIGLTFFLL